MTTPTWYHEPADGYNAAPRLTYVPVPMVFEVWFPLDWTFQACRVWLQSRAHPYGHFHRGLTLTRPIGDVWVQYYWHETSRCTRTDAGSWGCA